VSQANTVEIYPWEKPWWKPAKGKEAVLAYLALIHVMAIIGVILFPIPSLPVLILTLALAMLGALGTTVAYHRGLAHRTVKLNKWVEQFLIFWTVINGSGNPQSWTGFHRRHHSKVETDDDISSPKHGFWWSHLRWLYQNPPVNLAEWCPDLQKPGYNIWSKLETPLILLSLTWGIVLGWEGFFWLGAIRLVYSLHGQCAVNSLTHMGELKEGDSSKNLWWLGPLQMTAWGENWHRNHHSATNSARFGWRWWQVDVGWYFIWTLEKLGLAHDVKVPKTRPAVA
jgi:stearoyl-CoA desaturase (delta-9 desaturase)